MKKSVLITGANGYIGSSLAKALESNYDVTTVSRKEMNLLDFESVIQFFTGSDRFESWDVVLHTAAEGGHRGKEDHDMVAYNNVIMFTNLMKMRSHFGRCISFGSGAELDRDKNMLTPNPMFSTPRDQYGMGKNIIGRLIQALDSFYNIRIFAVFDENELSTRFIKSNINRCLEDKPLLIHKNRAMDFFYMQDLITLVKHYIDQEECYLYKEANCSYQDKYDLRTICAIIKNQENKTNETIIEVDGIDKSYVGSGYALNFYELELIGLEEGIKRTYQVLKEQKIK